MNDQPVNRDILTHAGLGMVGGMEILPEGDARRNVGAGAHLTGLPGPTSPNNLPIPMRGDASIGASPILRG
ncbi:MAG: hypothetical protein KAY46_22145, partial [Burkholderiaceae bacterium]|nr:hypothetical protein [Burkholderiaceae bacterium]